MSDQDKRQRYDRTGETKVKPIDQKANEILATVFTQLIANDSVGDMIQNAKDNIRQGIAQARQNILNCETQLMTLSKKLGRIECDNEMNLYEGIIQGQIDNLAKKSQELEHNIQVGERVLELLKDYRDTDPKTKQNTGWSQATTTSSW